MPLREGTKAASYPTVAAVLIVKDEERHLPGCLASLRDRVDEIVIVDTGSRDATVQIATDAGARVLSHVWQNDFAAARNAGLDAAGADWILYIDADERLVLPGPGALGQWIPAQAVAGLVRFSPRQGYTRYREWRLFRRDDRIRFAGRFHETVIPAIRALSAQTGLPVLQTEVALDHLGYDAPSPAKLQRNLKMLTAVLAEDPRRAYCWHHLAETQMALGDRTAALEAAETGLLMAQTHPNEDQRIAASLIRQLIAQDRITQGLPVLATLRAALQACPEDHALRLMLAQAEMQSGDPQAALALTSELLAINPDDLYAARLAFDRRIFGAAALEVAALAHLKTGDRQAAALCHARLARLAPAPSQTFDLQPEQEKVAP